MTRHDRHVEGTFFATYCSRYWCVAAWILFLLLSTIARAVPVYSSDFSDPAPPGFFGVVDVVPVQGFQGIGNTHGAFSGTFLWNDSSGIPAERTTLTLTDLPSHTSISLAFLFAAIESWDGSKEGAPSPDSFNVEIDGRLIFAETFIHHYNTPEGNQQSYVPPSGGLLTSGSNLWGNVYLENGYDMGLDPRFQAIPHTRSNLEISWFASGAGWQGGIDESWAIDNLTVSVNNGSSIPEPNSVLLLALPIAMRAWLRARGRRRN